MPKNELVKLSSPAQLQVFANELKKFIVKQGLYSEIKGKNYVNVEGWEFAGASTGISPIVRKVEREDSAGEIKYRAEVELVNVKNEIVGWGMAICSNKEASKKMFDEYAIASMAQTRAIGKAYRNKLAFLMKMAGYESTPAEEVVSVKEEKMTDEELEKPATENQKEMIKNLIISKEIPEQVVVTWLKENDSCDNINDITKGTAIELLKELNAYSGTKK